MIQYQFTRIESLIDSTTNNVVKWIIGLSASDTENPSLSVYIDAEVPVPEDNLKPQEQWSEDEIRHFAMEYAIKEEFDESIGEYIKRNWFNQLKAQLESLKGQPIRGSRVVI